MGTYKVCNETDNNCIEQGNNLSNELERNGFHVLRTKMEQMLPLKFKQTNLSINHYYFEAHFKVMLDSEAQEDLIKRDFIDARTDIVHSTNATKYPQRSSFPRQILLTIREYELTLNEFFDETKNILNCLKKLGCH